MNLSGLSDSLAGVIETPIKCRQCGATTRLGNGLCLSCTLRQGLDGDREASRESFEAILIEDEVQDTHWRVGNYEILEEIGRGGMGVIYRARQRHSRRIVALKRMVSYHADSHETRERFRREAEAAASLDHPNILPIYEIGQGEDGLPFFSMKYAAGGSLQKAGPVLRSEPRECIRLMAKVARAVQYAHEHGVLHRDLKPGNILLDARGEPLVADFGLAKWLDTSTDLTRTLTIFGTLGYIAPEQAKGPATKLTPAADVYSLGAVLFDLLIGRPPFLGEHALAVIQRASAQPAPKLRSLAPALDRDLETIVARCLECNPNARYQSAAALAEDLDRWLAGRPILARPVRAPARVWRWSRRNPILAGAASACVLLALAVIWLLRAQFLAPRTPAPEKSIAVLPFANLSSEKTNAFFADGVQDQILLNLSRIAELKVISRTSVMTYSSGVARNLREIGRQLGVANVVEGSVQRSGNRVRVTAELIDARTDRHLWGQTYDRDLADVFAIQSEIASRIAEQLRAELSPAEKHAIERPPTSDITAFDLYTRAKNLVFRLGSITGNERANNLEAVDLLNEAVTRDPSFFDAYCQLASLHDGLYILGYDHTSMRLALADKAVEEASRLRPNAGETHLARARHLYQGYLDYTGALAELELARQSLHNDPRVFLWKGLTERRQGRWEDSIQNLERAIELDPRNFFLLDQTAQSYQAIGHYDQEQVVYNRILAMEPKDAVANVTNALIDFNRKADTQPAHQMIDSIRASNPDALPSVADAWLLCALAERDPAAAEDALIALGKNPINLASVNNIRFNRPFVEGVIAQMAGDEYKAQSAFAAARAEQEKIVRAQANYGLPLCVLGLIDAALGRKEAALREGRRAIELSPPDKDALDGSAAIKYLAMIATWADDKDLAVQQLAAAIHTPSGLSYGQLKLLPFWDPLRGDPRFEKIVASLAPK